MCLKENPDRKKKVILCDDKEPPWVNEEVRLLIKQKNLMLRTQRKNSDFDIGILNKLSEDLTIAITNSKLAYYRRIASVKIGRKQRDNLEDY